MILQARAGALPDTEGAEAGATRTDAAEPAVRGDRGEQPPGKGRGGLEPGEPVQAPAKNFVVTDEIEFSKGVLPPQARALAAEARRAAIQAGAHFRRDWADSSVWDELAKKRGIRLPQWHEAPTPGKLKFWLQTLVGEPFRVFYGEITPARLIALNPTMPLRAFAGQLLEAAAERPTAGNVGGGAAEGGCA